MLDALTNQSISLPFGVSESVEVCKTYLARRAFVVIQCGSKRLIGLRRQDSAGVVVQLEGVSAIQTQVSISNLKG